MCADIKDTLHIRIDFVDIIYQSIYMRTSLDIPDRLFLRAKRHALEHRTTVKSLVARGLEKILDFEEASHTQEARPNSSQLPKVCPGGKTTSYSLTNADIDRILTAEESARYS